MAACVLKTYFICSYIASVLSDYPRGHLQPFGHHRPPSVRVDEVTLHNSPRPKEFYEKYVKPSIPVIFRNAITESKAYQLWTDEYVRTNFGEMEVKLEVKYEKNHMPPVGEKYLGRDTIRHFVDTYHQEEGNNVYIVSDLPSSMYRDMGVAPSFSACGEMSRRIVEVDLWWSGGGSRSMIHKDAYNQMNCLLNGTKYWKLISDKYEEDIYKHPEGQYEIGGFSDINPEAVDLVKYPKVKNVEWSNITINAGDCLFLPKSYYHQVFSIGTNNKAVSVLFSRFDKRASLDFSDCSEDTDYKSLRSLADFDVQWPWHGKGIMVMGSGDLEEALRDLLLLYVTKAKDSNEIFDLKFFENDFIAFLEEYIDIQITGRTQIFNDIDRHSDGVITEDEVKQMSLDDLRKVAIQIETHEPSSTYEFEYSVMSFGRVWVLAKLCLAQYKELTKDVWLQHYRKAGGSNLFGEEIFNRLSGDKDRLSSEEITDEILYDALENWVKYFAEQYSNFHNPPNDFTKRREWYNPGLAELIRDGVVSVKPNDEGKRNDTDIKDEL